MPAALEISVVLFENIGLLAFLAVLYGLVPRLLLGISKGPFVGLLCGAGATLSILHPIHVSGGFIIDERATMILLSGLFGGPTSILIAVLIASAVRVVMGGAGTVPGLAMIVCAGVLSLVAYRLLRHGSKPITFRSLGLLALLSPLTGLGAVLLPHNALMIYLTSVAVPLNIAQVVGVLFLGTIMMQEDQRVAFEAKVKRQAVTDALSDLPNRRAFYARLIEEWQRNDRYDVPFCVLMLDIDRFKAINDRFGHKVGDAVIAHLGQVLKESCRTSDLPARLGGEEFAVLLPHTVPESAALLAERIRHKIDADRSLHAGEAAHYTVSIGVSSSNDFPVSPDELVSAADAALYESKSKGRNRVSMAAAALTDTVREVNTRIALARTNASDDLEDGPGPGRPGQGT